MLIKHYLHQILRIFIGPKIYILCLQDIKYEYNIRSNFVAWQSKGDAFTSKYQSIWVILDKLSWKLPQTTTAVFTLSYHGNNLSEFKLTKLDYTKLFFLEEKVIKIQYEWKLKKMFTKLPRWYFFFYILNDFQN